MDSPTHFVLVATLGGTFMSLIASYASKETAMQGAAAYMAAHAASKWGPCDPDCGGVAAWCSAPASGDYRSTRAITLMTVAHTDMPPLEDTQ